MKDNDGAAFGGTVGLSDCLDHINIALNYWYPLESDGDSKEECDARHRRLFEFRDRLAKQLKANANLTGKQKPGKGVTNV